MGLSTGVLSLLALLAAGGDASPLRPRRIPWPDPVPASSVGPLDWSTVHPPVYSPASRAGPSRNRVLSAQSAALSPPAAVDWRNRSGANYITTPQDQGGCNSCWAFAAAALIEAMVRIEHGVWSKRSEADVHGGIGAECASVGSAQGTLSYVAGDAQHPEYVHPDDGDPPPGPGIADWPCDPYAPRDEPYEHCADRAGRATHIPYFQALGSVADQKRWLDEYGPVVATFVLYDDFNTWKPAARDAVYSWDGVSESTGNHLALVVGYDDAKQAWIMKNSWGEAWGEDGFVWFAYDNANIDAWTKYGVANVNPDPWTRRRHQSGSMLQSGNGETHRNFELLLRGDAGITHVSRDGDSKTWAKVLDFEGSDVVGHPAIVGTSFDRDFHAVAVDSNQAVRQWVYSQAAKSWSLASTIDDTPIDGFPGVTQTDDSRLVMVVKHADGTLNEWHQPPGSQSWTRTPSPIAHNISQSGPSLVQSNINLDLYHPAGTSQGNLYTAAVRADGSLQLFSRPGHTITPAAGTQQGTEQEEAGWSAGETFASSIPPDSPPVMIQSYAGTADEKVPGAFHLVVAAGGGRVQHWTRDITADLAALAPVPVISNRQQGPWVLKGEVGDGTVRRVWALVQGSFAGRLHMVTEGVDGKVSYWEGDGEGAWEVVEVLPGLEEGGWGVSEPVTGG